MVPCALETTEDSVCLVGKTHRPAAAQPPVSCRVSGVTKTAWNWPPWEHPHHRTSRHWAQGFLHHSAVWLELAVWWEMLVMKIWLKTCYVHSCYIVENTQNNNNHNFKSLSSQSYGFSSSHVWMWGLDYIKKAKCQRNDAFELWCWRRLLRVPWTARRSN